MQAHHMLSLVVIFSVMLGCWLNEVVTEVRMGKSFALSALGAIVSASGLAATLISPVLS